MKRLTWYRDGSFRRGWHGAAFSLGIIVVVAGPGQAQQPGTASRRTSEGLSFARKLLADRRYELAADEFERFLNTKPSSRDVAEARFGLGRARLFLNQYASAREQFEVLLAEFPDDPNAPTARFRLGETAYLMGDNAAARRALEGYLAVVPEGIHRDSALPELGDACFGLGDFAAAQQAYEKALLVAPDGRLSGRTRFYLGRAQAAQGESAAALKTLADLADRDDPEWSGRARLQSAQVLASSGKLAEAVEVYEKIERDKPAGASVTEAQLRRGETLLKLDRREEGERLLQSLATEAPRNLAAPAAYALAGSLLERDQADASRAACDAAIARIQDSPWVPRLLFRSAEASLKQGRPDDARTRFAEVARSHPKDAWAPAALIRAARLALDQHDLTAAENLAGEFATKFPNHPLRADTHLIAARAGLEANKPREAITTLTALLADDAPRPDVAQSASYYLGLAYRADNQPEKAAALLKSLAGTPNTPVSAEAQLAFGLGEFDARHFAEAAEALEAYTAARPKDRDTPHALACLAQCRQNLGQTEATQGVLERLGRDFPNDAALPRTRIILGEAALDARRFDDAATLFRPVSESDDKTWKPRALSGLGWSLYKAGRFEEAATAFGSLVAAAPDDPLAADACLMRGRSLEAAGKLDEAMSAFATTSETYSKSDRAAQAVLARARLLAASGKPAEAALLFASYIDNLPKENLPNAEVVFVDWGWALHDAGKPSEADAVFRRLLDQNPDGPRAADARVFLAESEYAAGKLDVATALLVPVVADGTRANPELVQSALLRLARIDLAKGDTTAAARRFDRLLADFPEGRYGDEARFGKADATFKAGNAAAAEAQFATLADRTGPFQGTARLRRVQAMLALERWEDALAAADALKSDQPRLPGLADLDYARGRSLQMLARFDDARAAYQDAINAAPGAEVAAMAQWMRGETFLHQKNHAEAIREFLKTDLLYQAPEWQALALLEAGKAYEALNRPAEAIQSYEKSLARFPNDTHRPDVAGRLAALKDRPIAPGP